MATTDQKLLKIAGSLVVLLLAVIGYYTQKQANTMDKYIDRQIEHRIEYIELTHVVKDNTRGINKNMDDISDIKGCIKNIE